MREALHQGKRFRIPVKNKTKNLKLKRTPSFIPLPFCAVYPVPETFPTTPQVYLAEV